MRQEGILKTSFRKHEVHY
jgi:hypothetical protein